MKITLIKQQVKSPERVSVFVDEKYSFSLTLDQLLSERLKKGDELDEARLTSLKKLSDEGKLRMRALEWVMGRPHSERELRDYLYRKKADKDFIAQIINEFREKRYLNDEAFARWFVQGRRMRKNKSNRVLSQELAAKGVDRDSIAVVLQELEADEGIKSEHEALAALIETCRRRTRYQDEEKLIRYLLSKGYRYSDIKAALRDAP